MITSAQARETPLCSIHTRLQAKSICLNQQCNRDQLLCSACISESHNNHQLLPSSVYTRITSEISQGHQSNGSALKNGTIKGFSQKKVRLLNEVQETFNQIFESYQESLKMCSNPKDSRDVTKSIKKFKRNLSLYRDGTVTKISNKLKKYFNKDVIIISQSDESQQQKPKRERSRQKRKKRKLQSSSDSSDSSDSSESSGSLSDSRNKKIKAKGKKSLANYNNYGKKETQISVKIEPGSEKSENQKSLKKKEKQVREFSSEKKIKEDSSSRKIKKQSKKEAKQPDQSKLPLKKDSSFRAEIKKEAPQKNAEQEKREDDLILPDKMPVLMTVEELKKWYNETYSDGKPRIVCHSDLKGKRQYLIGFYRQDLEWRDEAELRKIQFGSEIVSYLDAMRKKGWTDCLKKP